MVGGAGDARRGENKGLRETERSGEVAAKKGKDPFLSVGKHRSSLTLILCPQLVEEGECRQFESPLLTALVAPLAVEGGVREVGWAAGVGVGGTGRAMRRSGRAS